MSEFDPQRHCCPSWAYGKKHDPGCAYAEATWPRAAIHAITALADWAEKRMLLDPTANEPLCGQQIGALGSSANAPCGLSLGHKGAHRVSVPAPGS
jgi:hypothetical protein